MSTSCTFSPNELGNYNCAVKENNLNNGYFANTKTAAEEHILANLQTADGTKYTIRYAISDVNNIYAGSDVEPANQGLLRKGKSLLVKVRHSGKSNSAPTGETYLIPFECGMTFKYPVNASVDDLILLIEEALAAVLQPSYDAETQTTDIRSNLTRLMKGAFPIK